MGRRSSSKRRQSVRAEAANEPQERAIETRVSHVASIADPALDELAHEAMAALNASAVAIAIDVDGAMTCRARAGKTAPEIGTPVQRDQGITGECVRTGAVVRCDNTQDDPRVDAAVCEQLQIGSILIAPLLWNGEVVGVAEAFFILPYSFDRMDVEFMQGIAQQIVTRVWGEEAQPEAQAAVETIPPSIATPEEQPTNAAGDPAQEKSPEDVALTESADAPVIESAVEFSSGTHIVPDRVSRVRAIATAFAALIVIVAVAILYARWNAAPHPQAAPAVARQTAPSEQPAQTAPADPLAELRHAAEDGDADAQYKLARAYESGSGVKVDAQQANAWLLTAAQHGSAEAQVDWARAHESSAPVEAYTWYVIAGQNGKSDDDAIRRLTPKLTPAEIAQVRLDIGRQYLAGGALHRDPVAAYVWFRLAEWGGNTSARDEMQQVQSQLTAKQMRQAETRASEWIRRHTAPAARNENTAVAVQR